MEILQKSISDWKNTVIEECKNCPAKDDCAGFFISAGKEWRGRGIKKMIIIYIIL